MGAHSFCWFCHVMAHLLKQIKKWLPASEFVKLWQNIKESGKLKKRWDRNVIITRVERQLNPGTNLVNPKARNYETGLLHRKGTDGIVTSNGQFQLGTHLMLQLCYYFFLAFNFPYGPGHAKTCFMSCASNKGADQLAHPCSLISTFVVRCLDSMICILAISKVSRFLATFCS